jgi:hypothetical protein
MNCTLPDAKGTVRTPQTSRPPLPNPVAKRASRSRFGKDLKFFRWDKFSVTDEHPKLTACKYREQAVYKVVVMADLDGRALQVYRQSVKVRPAPFSGSENLFVNFQQITKPVVPKIRKNTGSDNRAKSVPSVAPVKESGNMSGTKVAARTKPTFPEMNAIPKDNSFLPRLDIAVSLFFR